MAEFNSYNSHRGLHFGTFRLYLFLLFIHIQLKCELNRFIDGSGIANQSLNLHVCRHPEMFLFLFLGTVLCTYGFNLSQTG